MAQNTGRGNPPLIDFGPDSRLPPPPPPNPLRPAGQLVPESGPVPTRPQPASSRPSLKPYVPCSSTRDILICVHLRKDHCTADRSGSARNVGGQFGLRNPESGTWSLEPSSGSAQVSLNVQALAGGGLASCSTVIRIVVAITCSFPTGSCYFLTCNRSCRIFASSSATFSSC